MTWRAERDSFVPIVVVVLSIAVGVAIMSMLHGCARNTPVCVPARTTAIVAECRAQYRKAGCAKDPDRLCPGLVKACDAKVDALSDNEVCGQ